MWAEQDWIYLIHHMHQPDKEEDMEILHHCIMFEKKNLKGRKLNIDRQANGKKSKGKLAPPKIENRIIFKC